MSDPSTLSAPQSPSVRAEAAAWVARLQGPNRDAEAERAFRRWMEADPAHAAAFDRATAVWEGIGGAAAGMDVGPGEVARQKTRRRAMATMMAATLVAVGGGWLALRDPVYVTKVGEQRSVRLEDGSLLALNTDTKVVVHYTKGERDLRLLRGEAQFDVAKNPDRPFIVTAEGQQVRALGTSFVVRDEGKTISVTLLEGKVTVSPAADAPTANVASAKPVLLAPGDRVKVGGTTAPQIDRPRLQAVTAWRAGEVLLDDTPLPEAIAEMNRYSETPLRLEGEDLASLRVSGIFRSGETQAFARTVAAQFGLAVVEQPDRILLAQAPAG
ncbi:MAG TPA: FecR family protein [Caulobacteraceae bacterium]